ncbi:unnamed protein product, partial [Amoebophrya sp. A25]|eukprot:GSA25T00007327001.1
MSSFPLDYEYPSSSVRATIAPEDEYDEPSAGFHLLGEITIAPSIVAAAALVRKSSSSSIIGKLKMKLKSSQAGRPVLAVREKAHQDTLREDFIAAVTRDPISAFPGAAMVPYSGDALKLSAALEGYWTGKRMNMTKDFVEHPVLDQRTSFKNLFAFDLPEDDNTEETSSTSIIVDPSKLNLLGGSCSSVALGLAEDTNFQMVLGNLLRECMPQQSLRHQPPHALKQCLAVELGKEAQISAARSPSSMTYPLLINWGDKLFRMPKTQSLVVLSQLFNEDGRKSRKRTSTASSSSTGASAARCLQPGFNPNSGEYTDPREGELRLLDGVLVLVDVNRLCRASGRASRASSSSRSTSRRKSRSTRRSSRATVSNFSTRDTVDVEDALELDDVSDEQDDDEMKDGQAARASSSTSEMIDVDKLLKETPGFDDSGRSTVDSRASSCRFMRATIDLKELLAARETRMSSRESDGDPSMANENVGIRATIDVETLLDDEVDHGSDGDTDEESNSKSS